MTTEQISCAPGSSINEDLIAVFANDDVTDLIVLDGATSVADTDYLDAPQGDFQARAFTRRLPAGTALLAMTDGFYRLVDPYGLYTIEALVRHCRTRALAALMDELRSFEAARASGVTAVKSADDASAVLWSGRLNTEGTDD